MTRATQSPEAELLAMLSYRRPAFSKTERRFIREYLRPLGMTEDSFGNLYKRIGDAPILWSCHTDTVHSIGGIQTLCVTADTVRVADKRSNCLGADNTVGIWLMVEMIKANKPGLYVFHRAEEIGGQGSSHIAECNEALLTGLKYAVAFDRRGTSSIITHQAGGRCCSDVFASSLARALRLGHVHDSGGTFTDTANYTHLIGECSNVSAGFHSEHTSKERLDLAYVRSLREALLSFDWQALEHERQPGDLDPDEEELNQAWDIWGDGDDQMPFRSRSNSVDRLVQDHPAEIADWLESHGITAEELEEAIYQRGGIIRKR